MKFLLNSFKIRLYAGIVLSVYVPYVLMLPWSRSYQGNAYVVSMVAVAISHLLSAKTIYSLTNYPGKKSALTVISNNILWFIFIWVVIRVIDLPYSLWYLSLGYLVSIICCIYGFRLRTRKQWIFAYIPFGEAVNANLLPSITWVKLEQPKRLSQKIQGYVVDLHADLLDGDWQKFLAEETLHGMPVYHINQIEESLTGRVKIRHMYENNLGSLLPAEHYMKVKFLIDILLVFVSLPVVLPIMIITAVLIRLESKGSILFVQDRIGQAGKEFRIYKFRSMTHDSEKEGAKLASLNDMRVTRIGKFIRKTRIDELPQFFNVLKGDMSLIGPRPEQKVFVEQFSKEIPFYNYRHIVKPGISGWAQVTHGYASDTEETQVKVEYDFYYIKHFSFSLDVLIFFKTIKTMLTGFGAR